MQVIRLQKCLRGKKSWKKSQHKSKWVAMKKIKKILIFVAFGLLISYTFYLYSLRSDYVSWGSGLRDGLYFLVFFIIVLPLMILLSVLKLFIKEQNILLRTSYFFYTFLITIPAIGDAYSQSKLIWGMSICLIVLVLNISEYFLICHRSCLNAKR